MRVKKRLNLKSWRKGDMNKREETGRPTVKSTLYVYYSKNSNFPGPPPTISLGQWSQKFFLVNHWKENRRPFKRRIHHSIQNIQRRHNLSGPSVAITLSSSAKRSGPDPAEIECSWACESEWVVRVSVNQCITFSLNCEMVDNCRDLTSSFTDVPF